MKRVLVAGLQHESNSFNPIVAGVNDFQVIRGAEIFNRFRENDPVTGVIKPLMEQGYEVVPTLFASAVPNGEVDYDFYMNVKAEIIRIAKEEQAKKPIDAITLALHGSMRVKGLGEAEGYLLEELRQIFPNIPLFCSLDMHTTMTERMHNNCDGFVGYKCAPHTDRYETGVHASRMTIAALEDGFQPYSAWVKVPILIAGEQSSTTVEPMKSMIEECRRTETEPGIMAASYLMGFPWADNEDSSCAVYVVADSQEKADREALRLADQMWSRKDEFCFETETYPEQQAIDVAFEALANGQETPVYLSDSGDNPTAGSSSDCTGFLRLLMEDERTSQLRTPVLYGGIYDPQATLACKGKVGQEVTLTFGAKFDTKTTQPITATGTVKAYIENWDKSSVKCDVALFHSCGVDIVIAEAHIGYSVPTVFYDIGRDPKDADIVVCKLGYLTASHSAIAKRSIMALSKGSTNEDLKTLNYTRVPRPIFPLDDNFPYDAKANLVPKK